MEKTKSTKKSVKKVMLINAQHPEECRAVILKDNCIDTGCSLKIFEKRI